MILKDISFPLPQENILFDEVLFELAEQRNGEETLRLWESQQVFIVLGKIGKVDEDVYIEEATKEKIPILRRSSGGGTVVQGPGCLNFSLILSKQTHPLLTDLRKSYQWILGKITQGFNEVGIKCDVRPISDMVLLPDEKKFSGNAQRRGKNFILHHGTILYNFDLRLIDRYLRMPKEIPIYRRERGHKDFVINLSLRLSKIKQIISKVFLASPGQTGITPDENYLHTKLLTSKKYF